MIEHMSNILFALNPLLNNTGVNHPKLKEGNIVEKDTMPMTKKKNFFFRVVLPYASDDKTLYLSYVLSAICKYRTYFQFRQF